MFTYLTCCFHEPPTVSQPQLINEELHARQNVTNIPTFSFLPLSRTMSNQQFKMISSNYKDSDGFQLQFEENCSEGDRKFYMKEFPRVDLIAQRKPHCTTCSIHIGTSPISEKIVRTHSILGVSQCVKCFAFYVRTCRLQNFLGHDLIFHTLVEHISELW